MLVQHLLWKMPHNHDKKNSQILEYLIDLNFLTTMYQITECTVKYNCSVYLTFLLRYPCFLAILTLVFKLLEKYLKITHKTCWHIYTRPPIGVTPSECFISCEMCSDKISLKLGMVRGLGKSDKLLLSVEVGIRCGVLNNFISTLDFILI